MSNFRWNGDILFMGNILKAQQLPWYYIPVWISITTPIQYIILFLIGFMIILKKIIIGKTSILFKSFNNIDFFILSLLISPILSVIVFHSALYSGWRHLYFIYPLIIYIAVFGLFSIKEYFESVKKAKYNILITVSIIMFLIGTLFKMIEMHPFQMVYFNCLAGTKPENNFEVDYWGLSFRKGLEFVINDSKSNGNDTAKIFDNSNLTPIKKSLRILPKIQSNKIIFTNLNNANYLLSTYSEVNYQEDSLKKKFSLKSEDEIYNITVDNIKIFSVFRLKKR